MSDGPPSLEAHIRRSVRPGLQLLCAAALLACTGEGGPAPPTRSDLAAYVDPFIGTGLANSPNPVPVSGRGGSVFPGPAAPFGMVQFSPDMPECETSGYLYGGTSIAQFSLTHYSGAGCWNNGDLPLMPSTEDAAPPVTMDRSTERASPGYYGVRLSDGIRVELTATQRTAFGRFTFPAEEAQFVVFDAGRTRTIDPAPSLVVQEGDTGLTGYTTGGRFCGAGNEYRLYFALRTDRPFDARIEDGRASLRFARDRGRVVNVRVGLSYVSAENARLNLEAENPGWDFDAVHAATRAAWNERLGAIEVEGGSESEKVELYTALYHALLFPSVFSDVNGQYLGFDGAVHDANGATVYANFSGWDIYRSQVQLLALLFPSEASDMVQSLVRAAEQCGALPRWTQNNAETGVMVGDPGPLMVVNAHAFGATDYDQAAALETMLHTGSHGGPGCNGVNPLSDLGDYLAHGYLPGGSAGQRGAASSTLEYTSRDFAVAQLALELGDEASHRELMARSAYWQALIHPDGLLQTRERHGGWLEPLATPGGGANHLYVEGNAEQYTWMVPYDPRSLFDALGGDEAAVARLDAFHSQLNAGIHDPYCYMGNEPSFGTAWLYNWAGAPWRTQDVVRRILEEAFLPTADGLPGNDDLGATSSWYVWGAIGLYPAIPGVGGFAVASPVFETTRIRMGQDGVLEIHAAGAPARYIQSMSVDGQAWNSPWLPRAAVWPGARVDLVLGDSPGTWGGEVAPPSYGPGTFDGLADACNERATTAEGEASPTGFDGLGYSFSSAALAEAGVVPGAALEHDGTAFIWPDDPTGLDNVVAVGQTIRVATDAPAAALVFLGAASFGPSSGEIEIHYADGTTATAALGFSDWTLGAGAQAPSFDNEIVLALPYRNAPDGSVQALRTYLFAATVELDSSRELVSYRLPRRVSRGKLHVFAVSVVPG